MARWARLIDNIVIETFEWPDNPHVLFDPSWTWVECPEGTMGNATFDGEVWDNPPPPPNPEPYEPPHPTLPPLTRRQLRLGLLSIGITAEDVETEIATIADPAERAAAMIEWEDATHYRRDHWLVTEVATAMELPPEQVDTLWAWAAGM